MPGTCSTRITGNPSFVTSSNPTAGLPVVGPGSVDRPTRPRSGHRQGHTDPGRFGVSSDPELFDSRRAHGVGQGATLGTTTAGRRRCGRVLLTSVAPKHAVRPNRLSHRRGDARSLDAVRTGPFWNNDQVAVRYARRKVRCSRDLLPPEHPPQRDSGVR